MTNEQKECGKQRLDGKPCTRAAGWGTDRDHGPCRDHTDDADEKMKQTLMDVKQILEEELVSIQEACRRAGTSIPTLHRYRKKFPDLDEEITRAIQDQYEARADAMEDAAFRQVIEGKAPGSLTKFMLQNYRPDRFADRKHITADVDHTHKTTRDALKEAYEEETGLTVTKDDSNQE